MKIDNHVKRENKLEEKVKNVYAMIFKNLCPRQIQNRIKENPKYGSILNYPLQLMHVISQ